MKCKKNLPYLLFLLPITLTPAPPRLTVMMVVDQFAHAYLEKLGPFLHGGIKKLLENGIVYNNAYIPHAQPSTSTGHTALGTGCLACEHGIIGNSWRTVDNKKYKCDFDAVYGKSAINIMVDCFADQFVLASQPKAKHKAFSLSFKSRAAIGMGGNLAKAFWFDTKQKQFTTSDAYLDKLPSWVKQFNKQHNITDVPPTLLWNLFYPNNPLPYDFAQINDYRFTRYPFSLINIPFKKLEKKTDLSLEELFLKTPHANQYLLDFALECIKTNTTSRPTDHMFLALSLSPLDPLGHYYGPESREVTDMIYHLDWQLDYFMDQIKKIIPEEEVLFIFTADHGVEPIIELVQERGDKQAHRINQKKIVKALNTFAKQKWELDNLVISFHSPQFFLNRPLFYSLPLTKQRIILRELKRFLKRIPGIKNVWTATQVVTRNFDPKSLNQYYQNQFYKRRSGELTCKIEPYCAITKHPRGTHHKTPYEPNTHIPLILYKKGELEKKQVNKIVYALQLPNTLSLICGVNKPSASVYEDLLCVK